MLTPPVPMVTVLAVPPKTALLAVVQKISAAPLSQFPALVLQVVPVVLLLRPFTVDDVPSQ